MLACLFLSFPRQFLFSLIRFGAMYCQRQHVQELAQAKERLRIRESDVAKLQDALNGLQTESRRLGETHTSDRFSMELELDRTKRDLARCETELISATGENERRSALLSQRELALATLVCCVSPLAVGSRSRLMILHLTVRWE